MRRRILALLGAMALAASLFADADVADSYELLGAVWPLEAMPVSYCVNPGRIPIGAGDSSVVSVETFEQLVRDAFQKWEDLPSSSISFYYAGLCETDPGDRFDGVNTVGWGRLAGQSLGGTAIVETNGKYLRAGTYGQIIERDIIIDTRFAQSYDDVGQYVGEVLPYTLLHEVGHFIGIGHSKDKCAVMYASIGKSLEFCQDDIDAAATLYP